MAQLISTKAIVSTKAKLEYPVRVFAYGGVQKGAEIGRYTCINRNAFIGGGARIGRFCTIYRSAEIGVMESPTTMLSTHSFQYSKLHFEDVPGYTKIERDYKVKRQKTLIGHDVMIGAKGIVKGGVTIGTGAVIGSNSYVDEDVPPYAIVAGSPAKIIRFRFPEAIIEQLLASKWWELTPADMEGMAFDNIELVLEQIPQALAYKQAQEAAPKPKDPAKAAAEDDPVVRGLKQGLVDMHMPDNVIHLVMDNASEIAGRYDPFDEGDQEVLRNKLAYLMEFVSARDTDALTVNEQKHISGLFRQKH